MKLRDAEYTRAEAVMRRLMELEVEAAVNSRTEPTDEALSLTDGPMREGLAKLYELNVGDQRRLEVARVTRWPVREDYKDHEKLHLALLVCIRSHGNESDASAPEVDDDPFVVLFTEQSRVWVIAQEEDTSCT